MHPYILIKWLAKKNRDIRFFNFSFYKYKKNTIEDERIYIKLSREQLLNNDFTRLNETLPIDNEIAFHSNLEMDNGSTFHVPLFDMATNSRATLEVLKKFLPSEIHKNCFWFDSGRSFHGYSLYPISHENWVKLMGLLLLVNQKDMKPVVDPRWIGHRLIAGYSALRWTKNTDNYLKTPNLNYSLEKKFFIEDDLRKNIISEILSDDLNSIY